MVSRAKVTHCCPPQPPKAAAPLIPHIPVLDIFPACSLCFIACGSLCLSQHCACCPLSLGMLAVPHPHNARLCFFFSTSQAGGNANVAQSHRAGSVPTASEPDPTTAHHWWLPRDASGSFLWCSDKQKFAFGTQFTGGGTEGSCQMSATT